MESFVDLTLIQQQFNLLLNIVQAGRWCLSLGSHRIDDRIFETGRLGFESFFDLWKKKRKNV